MSHHRHPPHPRKKPAVVALRPKTASEEIAEIEAALAGPKPTLWQRIKLQWSRYYDS